MAIRYHTIIKNSHVDGPGGSRMVLVTQGCTIRCPGCQNEALWQAEGQGHLMAPMTMAAKLLAKSDRITITGGEPTDQPRELWNLMVAIRTGNLTPYRIAHVIIYTGHVFEDLFENLDQEDNRFALAALLMADIVVDGPYRKAQDDNRLQWRGSHNQRAINIRATAQETSKAGHGAAYMPYHLQLEDWDIPTLSITQDGIVGAEGLIKELTTTQENTDGTRRCGAI